MGPSFINIKSAVAITFPIPNLSSLLSLSRNVLKSVESSLLFLLLSLLNLVSGLEWIAITLKFLKFLLKMFTSNGLLIPSMI